MKRGPKPKGKVLIKWSADFAYAIGLLATDGNLSQDGRHISFVSKDREQIDNFQRCLDTQAKVGTNLSGSGSRAYRVQFSDASFCQFLNSIGIFPNKSKTIGKIAVPEALFFDFLRGCFDGDGTIYSYWDKRWPDSFMYYVSFATASVEFMKWLRSEISDRLGVQGHTKKDSRGSTFQLSYAKSDSAKIISAMYGTSRAVCLSRKKLKIEAILAIVQERRATIDMNMREW